MIAGGQTPTKLNRIEFVTIATTGNAQDFGEFNATGVGALSSATRGIFCGGYTPTVLKGIEK